MKELVFALEFKGRAEAVPGVENRLHARTSAPGQTLTAVLKRDGVWMIPAMSAASSSVTSFAGLSKYIRDAASTPYAPCPKLIWFA